MDNQGAYWQNRHPMKIPALFLKVSASLLFATITGCGSGGGSSSSPSTEANTAPQPFTLLSSQPGDKAANVGREAALTLTFSEPIDAGTANASALKLSGPDGIVVPVTVSATGNELRVLPTTLPLPGNTTYQLDLGATIASTNGRTLGAATSRSFTTAAQHWAAASSKVSGLSYFTAGTAPVIANDGKGNTVAVWYAVTAPNTIYFSLLDAQKNSWSAPAPLYVAAESNPIGGVQMVSAPTGDVYLGWNEYRNGDSAFLLKRYRADLATWEAATEVSVVPATAKFDGTVMAADPSGKLYFFSQAYGFATAPGLFASSYDLKTSTWSPPVRLDTASSNYFYGYALAVDGSGNAVAAWVENGLKVSRYNKSDGSWSAPLELDKSAVYGLRLAASANGNVALSWKREYGMMASPTAHAAIYDVRRAAWSPIRRLDKSASFVGVNPPVIAIDSTGNVTAVWLEGDAINGARFDAASSQWSEPQTVLPRAGILAEPRIGADSAGNVIVTAVQDNLPIAAHFYSRTKQWNTAAIHEYVASPYLFANSPALVVAASGTATAVWSFNSGLNAEMRANRFQ